MDSFYQAFGGAAVCRQLANAFYARVDRDPLLRPLFPGKTLRCAIEEFSAFLTQFLGGAPEDAQHRWWLSLRESHLRFKIGPKERAAWMRNMIHALDDVPLDEPVRTALRRLFEESSAYVVNAGDRPVEREGKPAVAAAHQEISWRWRAQRALDEAVAAVRGGDAGRATALAESAALQRYFEGNLSVLAALLAVMIRGGDPALLVYVQGKLRSVPGLARERYSGRTLLHGAAAAGSLSMVQVLLELGADPNTKDSGGHTALYCLANECEVSGAGGIVRTLVRAGANVNACDGVKRCTPLHMAARRGNVEIAEALLNHGAAIEARDSLGDTPLRRAVNCRKAGVVTLLVSRGADAHSTGSKGLTPLSAVRTAALKQLLQTGRKK